MEEVVAVLRLTSPDGEYLEVEFGQPQVDRANRETWLPVVYRVLVDGFTASVPAFLQPQDLQDLVEQWQLVQTLSVNREMWLLPTEPSIAMHFVDETELSLYCRLMHPIGVGSVLTFSLPLDESRVDAFIEELKGAMEVLTPSDD